MLAQALNTWRMDFQIQGIYDLIYTLNQSAMNQSKYYIGSLNRHRYRQVNHNEISDNST